MKSVEPGFGPVMLSQSYGGRKSSKTCLPRNLQGLVQASPEINNDSKVHIQTNTDKNRHRLTNRPKKVISVV